MSKISNILDSAGGNLARPTMFSISLSPPSSISNMFSQNYTDVLCKTIKIPDITVETIELKYKGHPLLIPGRTNQVQTIELNFYLDENHGLRDMLATWIGGMDDRYYAVTDNASKSMSESRDWYGNIRIDALDFMENTVVQSYIVEGVFPTSVEGPDYDSSGVGNVTELSVTFALYRVMNDSLNTYDSYDSPLDAISAAADTISGGKGYSGLDSLKRTINTASNAWGTINSSLNSINDISNDIQGLF
ncbi:MAG: hypothetical protein ACTSU7_09820 [Candidatus Heimdallarchaeaceae archaeon]